MSMRFLGATFVVFTLGAGCGGELPERPQVDYSCIEDVDCVPKNVGNCCGYFPRCVDVLYQPDPEAVMDWCEANQVVSACGWSAIDSCACVENTCRSLQDGREV